MSFVADDFFALAATVDGTTETLTAWTQYSFNSHFLTPTDAWSLSAPAHQIPEAQRAVLVPGATVELRVGAAVQARGYVEKVDITAGRDGGATMQVSGRDVLAPMVDASMDPRTKFKAEATFKDLVEQCAKPFGFTKIITTTQDDRTLKAGLPPKTSKKGKLIASTTLEKQLRPHDHEGAFAFMQRIGTRLGFWVWPGSEEGTLVVGEPDFEQLPIAKLVRTFAGASNDATANNVLSGEVTFDITLQPSFIVAEGTSGGAEWGHSSIRVAIMNPFVLSKPDVAAEAEAILKQFDPCPVAPYFAGDNGARFDTSARAISTLMAQKVMRNTVARPAFLHDEESKTYDQLVRFARREMSERTRKSFTAHYSIRGHRFDSGAVPTVDTMVHVYDEVVGIDEPLWILSRTLKRSRSGGTTTDLELIRPYTLLL